MLITDPKTGKTHAPRPGEIFKNPNLARTFREVAEKGKSGFYEGRVAEAIVERALRLCFPALETALTRPILPVAVVQSKGGVMTLEDLKNHTTTPVTPISINYGGENGVRLWETPPNGQGLTALIALGIIEAMKEAGKIDLSKTEHLSAQWFHILMCVHRSSTRESLLQRWLTRRPRAARPSVSRLPTPGHTSPTQSTRASPLRSCCPSRTWPSAQSSSTRSSPLPSSTRGLPSPRPTQFSLRLSTSLVRLGSLRGSWWAREPPQGTS